MECTKCGQQYCGQSKNRLRDRFSNHLGYVRTKKVHQATGHHFNNGGCKIHHMSITVLEKVKTNTLPYRLAREKYYIEKFNLKYRGLNRNGGGWKYFIALQILYFCFVISRTCSSFFLEVTSYHVSMLTLLWLRSDENNVIIVEINNQIKVFKWSMCCGGSF